MVDPPLLLGAVNEISIVESLATAETFVGIPGVPAMAVTVDDEVPVP